MSVVMTLRAQGDVEELERRAAANPEAMQALVERAKQHGLIAHRFYGTAQGEILVIDEWESAEGFQAFFSETTEIEGLMREVGVTGPPEIKFWRELETHDRVDPHLV